jgi:hypothetical protein
MKHHCQCQYRYVYNHLISWPTGRLNQRPEPSEVCVFGLLLQRLSTNEHPKQGCRNVL